MGKRSRNQKQSRREKPTAKVAEPRPGGAFYIGSGGPPIYLDAESDDDRGGIDGDGRPVQISGRFDHNPVPGGSSTYVRYLGTGKYAHPLSAATPRPAVADTRFLSGFLSNVPARRCPCGFEAFTWQRACPKCGRSLLDDQ
jgi:hypothetical protein